jgi:hypothetical protein
MPVDGAPVGNEPSESAKRNKDSPNLQSNEELLMTVKRRKLG